MANYNVTITDEGAALLATVIATQGTITFTEARLSDTNYDGAAQTLTENTFTGTFLTTTVSASKNSATELKASAIFHSSSVTEPHDMYSLGIIGTDGNTTALVCVLTTTNPDNVEPTDSLSSTYAFNAFIGVSSTDNITVTGTAAGIVYDTDIINTLNSTDATKPLSANMGHTLGEEIDAIVNVYGAKNLYKTEPSYSDNPHSENGLTFTINEDKSVTVSGIASAATWFRTGFSGYKSKSDLPYGAGCILSGESNGSPYNYATYIVGADDTSGTNATNYTVSVTTGEVTIPDRNAYSCVYIFVESGTDFSTPHTFYPMIRDARIVDPTYEPYAETNQQLTVNKANRSDLASLNLTGTKNTTGATITAGTYFYLNGQYCRATQDILNNADFTENTNYKGTSIGGELKNRTKVTKYTAAVNAHGNIPAPLDTSVAIVSAFVTANNTSPTQAILLIPFMYTPHSTWYLKAMDTDTMTAAAENTSIDVEIYYTNRF